MKQWFSNYRLWAVEFMLCAVIIIGAAVSPKIIPYNMDEFSHYHAFGCLYYPLSGEWNKFREACGSYDLKLPFTSTYLPLRSYTYIGVAQTIPFLLFWGIFHAPIASRIQGAFYLMLATFLLARWLTTRWRTTLFAALLFPPFCLPFIFETGTVGILISLLIASLLIIQHATKLEARKRVGWGIALGLMVLLGISIKLVFFWTIPALGLYFLARLFQHGWKNVWALFVRFLPFSLASIAALLLPLTYLLMATDRNGYYFWQASQLGGFSLTPTDLWHQIVYLGAYWYDASRFDYRVIEFAPSVINCLPAVISLGLVAYVLITQPKRRGMLWFLLALAIITFAIMITSQSAWAAHHFVFAFVFGIAAVAISFDALTPYPLWRYFMIALALAFWLSLAIRYPKATIQPDTNFDKDQLTNFLYTSHLDERVIQVHTDWGTYYINHVFGDKSQMVLYIDTFLTSPSEMSDVRTLAYTYNRGVLVLTRTPDTVIKSSLVQSYFGNPVKVYHYNTWAAVEFLK